MVDLLSIAPAAIDSPDSRIASTLDPATLDQIILKLQPSPEAPELASQSDRLYEPALTAIQRLTAVIAKLKLSAPADQSQTSEALMPYVSEEAQDVLDALHLAPPIHTISSPFQQGYFWLKSLAPWLLWGIARSSYGVMRLMEGKTAQVLQANESWQTGILRLVACLDLSTSYQTHSFDLTTHQLNPSVLSADRLMALPDPSLGRSPIFIADLLDRLTEQVCYTTPAIVPFLNNLPVQLLIPHQNWHSGILQLRLGLEFIPSDEKDEDAPLQSLKPLIQFTDTTWLEQYGSIIAQQQLDCLLNQCFRLQRTPESLPESQTLSSVVEEVCHVIDRLQTSLTLASRNIPHTLRLDDLAFRLLWCWMHSAYEVMQLMSGIRARLLQPRSAWETGILRLSVSLNAQTPEQDWQLDLITEQSPDVDRHPLPSDTLVQSDESQWCQQPNLLEHLQRQVQQQIETMTPEIQLLLQGTEVDLQDDEPWQPGVIQLKVSFEWMAD
ncbi:MAG: hypothetical protein HC865_24810 [Cyanobacteria bacterium RU_5_0]|nr:hypothetical protein [Cyanobacteria bacterium RU_5_0]